MDCIVLGGGIPAPDDPLYPYTQGKPKPLIEVNGRPMLRWVLDALEDSQYIDDIVIVGLPEAYHNAFNRPAAFLPDHGSLVANGVAGAKWILQQKPDTAMVIGCTSDIPMITGDIIDHFVEMCRPFDSIAYHNFITQKVMESRFPHSNRTYVKLKEANIAGGDVIMMQARLATEHADLWEELSNVRKHAWRIAGKVGFMTVFKLLLRQLTVADIEKKAGEILGGPVTVHLNPHAELAMDGDKPDQVDLLRAVMQQERGGS